MDWYRISLLDRNKYLFSKKSCFIVCLIKRVQFNYLIALFIPSHPRKKVIATTHFYRQGLRRGGEVNLPNVQYSGHYQS